MNLNIVNIYEELNNLMQFITILTRKCDLTLK
jgi:hypothetical protein